MQIKIQVCVLIGLIILFSYITKMIRKRSLEIFYVLAWFGILLAVFVFTISPAILELVTNMVGITLPSNLLCIFGFVFFVLLVSSLTIVISKLSNENKTLVQEVTLLKLRVDSYKKEE